MAGGMNRPGTPTPAFVREALEDLPGPHQSQEYRELTAPLPEAPGPSRRHCWVRLPDGELVPGLVIEWRREEQGWAAQTTYVVDGVMVTAWVEAANLSEARRG